MKEQLFELIKEYFKKLEDAYSEHDKVLGARNKYIISIRIEALREIINDLRELLN